MFPFKMSRSYQRPENALKRANEFIDVEKPLRALEVLYEVIKRGKTRSNYSEKLLEPIMFKYLELCVDLKKSHMAKEGLYQYRNIFQSVNVSSLETVVRFYLRLADERTESARKESHQAVVEIDDLDNLATPEEILLSAVSGEDAQDRSDRTILIPWVKFLWESYRQCLELLRTNSRVERLYHDIAKQAFKFCEKYGRKTEFRKLCDNLRLHLVHIQKQQGSATAVNLNNPETQQMNLETRLEQLNYAIKMELWQEAYKAIEDISDLMSKSKKMPKPHVMASYYQKLALVFWKAGNQLFHAAALFKLFQLLRDQKKNITADELSKRASTVLVATLAIPLPSAHPEFDRFIETEKSAVEKIEKLATLLTLPKPPTRISLIKDLVRLNVVTSVPVELQNLYQLMEVDFDPLRLCKRMETFFTWINDRPESGLPQYVPALQSMTITRLVKQVAQVYQTITFKRLLELSIFMTAFRLERILVDLVRHNDLQIRIDHRDRCIHFGKDLSQSQREDLPEGPSLQTLPSETIRCQLVYMSEALHKCVDLITPVAKRKEMHPLRTQSIQQYNQTKSRDHQSILRRQHIIEERKEMLENQNLEREDQLRRAQEDQMRKQKEEEQERLRREASKREKERQEEQLKQIHTKQIKDKLLQISKTSYGQKMIERIDKEELLNLGAEEILQRQVEELEKERKELQKKLKLQERNVDYYERARRILEIPRLKKQLEVQKEKDMVFWKTQEEERVEKLIEEHTVARSHSKRLSRMSSDRQSFIDKLKSMRRSDIEKKLNDFNARLEVERKNRLAERKEQRRRDRREAFNRQKQEEEQQRRDEEMKKQREEAERLENERMKEEEERSIRRREEQEAEEDRRSQRMDRGDRDRDRDRGDSEPAKAQPWRARLTGGTWRQKEQESMDTWRAKDNEPSKDSQREPEKSEPTESRFSSKDIRKDSNWDDTRKDDIKRTEERQQEPSDNGEWRKDKREEPREEKRDLERKEPEAPRANENKGEERRDEKRVEEGQGRNEMNRFGDRPASPRRGEDSRDMRRDDSNRRGGSDRDRDDNYSRDGPDRDGPRRASPDRDGMRKGGPDRGDFRRGGSDRDRDDFRRGGSDRDRDDRRGGPGPGPGPDRDDFRRGASDRDRDDFRRGGSDRDREDFRRGGPDRDRDDFRRGGADRSDNFRRRGDDFNRGGDREESWRPKDAPRGDDAAAWRKQPGQEDNKDDRFRREPRGGGGFGGRGGGGGGGDRGDRDREDRDGDRGNRNFGDRSDRGNRGFGDRGDRDDRGGSFGDRSDRVGGSSWRKGGGGGDSSPPLRRAPPPKTVADPPKERPAPKKQEETSDGWQMVHR